MSRPLRILYPGAVYHVMNRGLARQATFLDEADHAPPNLPRIMRHLGGLYTQRFNRATIVTGLSSAVATKPSSSTRRPISCRSREYIHLNPVAAGLAHDPGAYRWSSHRLYRQPTAPDWLVRDEVMACFPDLPFFEQFVAEGNEASLEAFYASGRWRPILGDAAFIAWALGTVQRSPEHSRAEGTPQFPSVEAVIAAVSAQTGVSPDAFLAGRRGSSNLPRDLAVYVASRVAGFPHAAVKPYFGIGSDSAVAKMCDRTVRRLRTTPYLRHVLRSLVP